MASWLLDPETTHLNHGSFGACPVEVLAVQSRLREDMERNPVDFMLRRYQPLLEQSRHALARFVGADADGLVLVPNATYGVNSVLRSLEPDMAAGAELVITTHTYNACRNAAAETARRVGGSLVVADIPFPISDPSEATDAVLSCVSDRTALVIIDHVTSATGLVLPLEDIVAGVDGRAPVLVDGAHGPGMLDLDLASLGASFYTANCHKWMCAPKGAAFLHVTDRYRSSTAAAAIGHGYNGGWPDSGSHFHAQFDWTGTDDPTARLCIPEAIDVMASHSSGGWAQIRGDNHRLALAGRDVIATALGVAAPAPDAMIGCIASMPLPPVDVGSDNIFDPLMDNLHRRWAIEVPVFAWPEAPNRLLRISAQQYNSIEDYHRLAEALATEFP